MEEVQDYIRRNLTELPGFGVELPEEKFTSVSQNIFF